MASVIRIGDKWRAQVRRRNHKPATKTFDTKKAADAWARGLESRIDTGKEPRTEASYKTDWAIDEYRRIREEGGRPVDPTTNTHYMLNHLREDLGHEPITALLPSRMVKWASARKSEGAGPYTVS